MVRDALQKLVDCLLCLAADGNGALEAFPFHDLGVIGQAGKTVAAELLGPWTDRGGRWNRCGDEREDSSVCGGEWSIKGAMFG